MKHALVAIIVFCIMSGASRVDACQRSNTEHRLYHHTWYEEPNADATHPDAIEEAMKTFKQPGQFFFEADVTNNTTLKLRDFMSESGLGMFHHVSHGFSSGNSEWDHWPSQSFANVEKIVLEGMGLEFGVDFDIDYNNSPEPSIVHLTYTGMLNSIVNNGRFTTDAIVAAWTSYSIFGTAQGWLNMPNVSSVIGKSSTIHNDKQWWRFYTAFGCLDMNYAEDGTILQSIDAANQFSGLGGATDLNWIGDYNNSLACYTTCKDVSNGAAEIRDASVQGGWVHWTVNEEIDTEEYRLVGILQSGSADTLHAIQANGPHSDYTVELPHDWIGHVTIQERETGHDEWMTAGKATEKLVTPDSWREGPRLGLHLVGLQSHHAEMSAYAREMSDAGITVTFETVETIQGISEVQQESGRVFVDWTKRSDARNGKNKSTQQNGDVLLVSPSQYATEVEAYRLELDKPEYELGAINTFYYGYPYDSAWVASHVSTAAEDYIILFGNTEYKNGAPATDLPLPWDAVGPQAIRSPLQLADWEHHQPDGSVSKSVGLIPIYGPGDIANYLIKMIGSRWKITHEQDDYRSVDFWGGNEDWWSSTGPQFHSGAAVTHSIKSIVEELHPSWIADTIFAAGNPTYMADTYFSLQQGKYLIGALGTISTAVLVADMFGGGSWPPLWALEFTGNYSHMLALACDAHWIDRTPVQGISTIKDLINLRDGGLVSSIGPTRGGEQWYYVNYIREYLRILSESNGFIRGGDLHRLSRKALYDASPDQETLDFNRYLIYIGDPTLPIYGPHSSPYVGVDGSGGNNGGIPHRLAIDGVTPNPFNPRTQIEFSLPERGHVSMEVFDIAGRRVKTLEDRVLSAGNHKVQWQGSTNDEKPAASGVYFIRLRHRDNVVSQKIVLLK